MRKQGPHLRVPYRREREGKTDYRYRKKLLQSGKPRLVARISLKNVRAQVAAYSPGGDRILASAFSKELDEWGWKGHNANTPAAYLVGFLCGFRAKDSGIQECVIDIDKFVSSPQAKVLAVLKGALDAGLNIPHDEGVLPSEERFGGEHISSYAQDLKSDDEEYQSQFSDYLEKGLAPEDLPEHFKQVKQAIETQYGE